MAAIRDRILELRRVRAGDLQPHDLNPRRHPEAQREAVSASLVTLGQVAPLLAFMDGEAICLFDGHLRAALDPEAEVTVALTDLTPAEGREALAILDRSAGMAETDPEALSALLASIATDFDAGALVRNDGLDVLLKEIPFAPAVDPAPPDQAEARRTLAERFGVPPFSVLDARQGYWQERKRAWLALGIQSELGRGEGIVPNGSRREASQDGCYERGYGKPTGLLGFSQQAEDYRRSEGDYSKSGAVAPVGEPGGLVAGLARRRGYAPPKTGLLGESEEAAEKGLNHYRKGGPARSSGQDLMKGENPNFPAGGNGAHPSEEGWRDTGLTFAAGSPRRDEVSLKLQETSSGTSIFDPVLCELVYRWFSPPGAAILDPFAGGSVRGIVASRLGRSYTGVDLSGRQLAANEGQAEAILKATDPAPRWIEGDAQDVGALAPGEYDLIFSCPPYADLERYSDDPRDLSTMAYADFLTAYRATVAACVGMLRDNRFACFCVGDVRDGRGFYRNFVADTIAAFQDAGATLYNEAILVTAVGSLPIRVGAQFGKNRKLGKTHQNVLAFWRGDPKRIPEVLGECDFGEGEEVAGDSED